MKEHFNILRNHFKDQDSEAAKSFAAIATMFDGVPNGGELHREVVEDVLKKAEDLPHHKNVMTVVVLVVDGADVDGFDEFSGSPKNIRLKSNALILGAADSFGCMVQPSLNQSMVIKAMFAFHNLIGKWGVGWFAEIFSRLSPLSWRMWKSEKK